MPFFLFSFNYICRVVVSFSHFRAIVRSEIPAVVQLVLVLANVLMLTVTRSQGNSTSSIEREGEKTKKERNEEAGQLRVRKSDRLGVNG